jgi:hypothetical protein
MEPMEWKMGIALRAGTITQRQCSNLEFKGFIVVARVMN